MATDPALLILTSLAGGPKHGYAMTVDIEEMVGSRLGPGTLYGAIGRLEEDGLIEAVPSSDRRRPYRLTSAGRSTLEVRVDELSRLTTAGRQRLQTSAG
jgi:DNA-binding PadR family transcriptional regulator